MIRKSQMSRRTLLRGAVAGAASASVLGLAACSGGGDGIVWGNWTYYLDFDEETGSFPTLDAFIETAGFNVQYIEDIDDNNTFYGKIKDQLELGQHTGYDVITFTDWMNGRLIADGQIQAFDYANLPTVEANMLEYLWNSLDVDQGREFTIPWQVPTSGWAWNTEAVPNGIQELGDFLNPDLHGKVGVLTEMRDTIGMIMAGQGVDPGGDWGDAEFDRALEWLDDGLQSGQISNVKGNSYTQDLETGATLAAMVWPGDVVIMNEEQGEQWTISIPESGGMFTADSFTVPNGTSAENKERVEQLIDFYYDPEIAAQVADYVWFITPVEGAQEAMESINPENVDNPFIFPDEEMESRLKSFRTLTPQEDQKYQTAFQNVLGL